MKRYLFFVVLFTHLVSNVNSQSWDKIGDVFTKAEKIYIEPTHQFVLVDYVEKDYNYRIETTFVYYEYDAYGGMSYKYFDHKLENPPVTYVFRNSYDKKTKYLSRVDNKILKIPVPVYERYLFGCTLMKSGWITFSIGLCTGAIGGILYGIGAKNHNGNEITAGAALLGCGGTIISVSIPLLCFGDNTKREANTLFETYNILK